MFLPIRVEVSIRSVKKVAVIVYRLDIRLQILTKQSYTAYEHKISAEENSIFFNCQIFRPQNYWFRAKYGLSIAKGNN